MKKLKEKVKSNVVPITKSVLVGLDPDNRKDWPAIADAVWARLRKYSKNPKFVFMHGKAPCIDCYDWAALWTYESLNARKIMSDECKFDCALYPELWRYIVERLPVLGDYWDDEEKTWDSYQSAALLTKMELLSAIILAGMYASEEDHPSLERAMDVADKLLVKSK